MKDLRVTTHPCTVVIVSSYISLIKIFLIPLTLSLSHGGERGREWHVYYAIATV